MEKVCSVKSCTARVKSRSLCGKHYERQRVHGDVHTNLRAKNPEVCVEDGCLEKPEARSLCKKHYSRWWNHGDTVLRSRGGENHPRWNGGRYRSGSGYQYIKVDACSPFSVMATKQGYVMEHRLVMAQKLGRPLLKNETVHHLDGDILNNSISNLQLRSGAHGPGVAYLCMDCGSDKITPTELR